MRRALLVLFLIAAAGLLACSSAPSGQSAGGPAPNAAALSSATDPADLLPVDCLLPGQVRKLGRNLTYLTARQPLRTSAIECEIRGGEYVAYDRANLQTALRVWLPLADGGDADAQNYVGEMYERGMGTTPDYAKAAAWYQRAADQGHKGAMVNLGQLYEKGRGVPRDIAVGIEWYRRASGLDDVALPFVSDLDSPEEVRLLREELSQSKEALAASQAEGDRLRAEIERYQEQLDRARKEQLDRQSEVDREREAIEAERQALDAKASSLAAESSGLAGARTELESRQASDSGEQQAARARQEEEARRLAARDEALRGEEAELASRREALETRETGFEAKERELAELEAEIESLRLQADARRQEVAALNVSALAEQPGPSIYLIDPQIPASRSSEVFELRGDVEKRAIVGRVEAPAGLLSLTLNDLEVSVDGSGIFRHEVGVRDDGTFVTIVAVDKQGKRVDRTFTMRRPLPDEKVIAKPAKPALPPIEFGRYYALIIGNDEYTKMPKLDTALVDARAVRDLLQGRYGFDVTLLENATRYQILTALNEMRSKLTEKDNLLIYYAGHGELDRINMRGHWLPVDAEPTSTANWISNIAITDILKQMTARHVMVVADSCYSGALTRSSLARLERGLTDEARIKWVEKMVGNRSRMALTSGGLKPVLDGGGGRHSIFARAFIDVLSNNGEVLEGQRLFSEISALVSWAAEAQDFDQLPQYAPIKFAGHESGDFFFVPRS